MKKVQNELAPAAGRGGLVVAVVGSRALVSCPALAARLAALYAAGELGMVVSGGAAGVDAQAAAWARAHGVPLIEHRPDYTAHGAAAPLVRNGLVVAVADLVLVVWDGVSHAPEGSHAGCGPQGGQAGQAPGVAGGPGPRCGPGAGRAGDIKKAGPPRREAPTGKPL